MESRPAEISGECWVRKPPSGRVQICNPLSHVFLFLLLGRHRSLRLIFGSLRVFVLDPDILLKRFSFFFVYQSLTSMNYFIRLSINKWKLGLNLTLNVLTLMFLVGLVINSIFLLRRMSENSKFVPLLCGPPVWTPLQVWYFLLLLA